MPAIGKRPAEQLAFPEYVPEGLTSGKSSGARRKARAARRPSRASRVEQRSVRDAFVSSVAWTRPPVSFQTSHESTVPNASPCAGCVAQQPLELRRGEIGIGQSPVRSRDRAPRKLARTAGRATVLPDDRVVHGLARRAIPEHRGLALVRDPDRRGSTRRCSQRRGLGGGGTLSQICLDRARPSRARESAPAP